MQTLEAMLSLAVFASIILYISPASTEPRGIDDSLYRMQLGQDAWRVLYLRGGLGDLTEGGRASVESDMEQISHLTGLCVYISGIEFTSCRAFGGGSVAVVSIRKTVISGGAPKTVTFSLRK